MNAAVNEICVAVKKKSFLFNFLRHEDYHIRRGFEKSRANDRPNNSVFIAVCVTVPQRVFA